MKPSEVIEAAAACIAVHRPFMIWGPAGGGKSESIAQMCARMKLQLIDQRAGQMDPTDIKGWPTPDLPKGLMKWLPPNFLPTKGKGLLFLDEINLAPASVQSSLYQLVLDRKVGDYILPPGWDIGCAGNRDSDRGNVVRMAGPLANRLVHLDYEVDYDEWKRHAKKSGVSDVNIAFLAFRGNLLHNFDPHSKDPAFPSPRTWFFVDQFSKLNLHPDRLHQIVTGTVGLAAATEYSAFMRHVKDLPTPAQIKTDPMKAPLPVAPSAMHAITQMLGGQADPVNFGLFLKYMGRLSDEFQVVFIHEAIETCPAVAVSKEFKVWSTLHHEVVL